MKGQIDGLTRDGRPLRKPRGPVPHGYAGLPGAGPEGETCGSCRYIERMNNGGGKRWAKCAHPHAPQWTCSARTDVLVRSPACQHWEEPDE